MERYYSAVHWGSNPTLIYHIADIRPYTQTDVNFSYDFTAEGAPLTAFLNINNLFDQQGQDIAAIPASSACSIPWRPTSSAATLRSGSASRCKRDRGTVNIHCLASVLPLAL